MVIFNNYCPITSISLIRDIILLFLLLLVIWIIWIIRNLEDELKNYEVGYPISDIMGEINDMIAQFNGGNSLQSPGMK